MAQIGYHGTSKRHHASLSSGLKVVQSSWDPSSGGELGPGFYIANNKDGAYLYGYGICVAKIEGHQAVLDGHFVELWTVSCNEALKDLKHRAVSSDKTWDRFPKEYFDNYDFVYLANDPGFSTPVTGEQADDSQLAHITQIKFNPRAYSHLSLASLEAKELHELWA